MRGNIAFPFLTLSDDVVTVEPWFVRTNGGEKTLGKEYVADWDYATELELFRAIHIDLAGAAKSLQIPSKSLELGVVVEIGTGAGRFPRKLLDTKVFEITSAAPRAHIELKPISATLSATLVINTTIVLRKVPSAAANLSPKLINNKLWSDRFITRLDGEEPRFPIELASFTSLFGDKPESRAPWYVSWNTGDWNRDFSGAVRLYLNSDFPEFIEQVQAGDRFLLQTISTDIVDQILEKLVGEDDVEDIAENAPVGSLAAQAFSWLRLAWPESSLSSLKQKLESQPGFFRASVWAIAEQQESL